jgi:hypothetical protein
MRPPELNRAQTKQGPGARRAIRTLCALGNPLYAETLIVAVSFPIETALLEFCGVINIDHITHLEWCAL